MNKSEHLLVCLGEECAEIIHIASKSLRFGLDDHHPRSGVINRDQLRAEFNDLLAVAELLEESGVINFDRSTAAIEVKKDRVRDFMDHAKSRQTLVTAGAEIDAP